MPVLKRSRQSLYEDEEDSEEEELGVGRAHSELRQDNVRPPGLLIKVHTDTQSVQEAEALYRT